MTFFSSSAQDSRVPRLRALPYAWEDDRAAGGVGGREYASKDGSGAFASLQDATLTRPMPYQHP
jgi:hypothetical protein